MSDRSHTSPARGARFLRGACLGLAVIGAFGLQSCRGGISEKPPVHLVLDMDFQQKVNAQSRLDFWADERGMRTPPAGTVAVGSMKLDDLARYHGSDDAEITPDEYLDNPLPASRENVLRGQERFNIHCAVCHDRTGGGNGLVLQRAKLSSPAAFNYMLPNLATEPRLRDARDGYLFQVITKGQGTMPAYAHQVEVEDRWRIVHYLRVLQSRFE